MEVAPDPFLRLPLLSLAPLQPVFPMLLCPFEDAAAGAFRPLADTRPVYDLRRGLFTAREALAHLVPHTGLVLHCRARLAPKMREALDVPVNYFPAGTGILFVNGRWVAEKGDVLARLQGVRDGDAPFALVHEGALVAAWVPALPPGFALPDAVGPEAFGFVPRETVDGARLHAAIPDLIYDVRDALRRDVALLTRGLRAIERPGATVHPAALLVEPDAIFVAPGGQVHAGAILDATEGPIFLAENASVMHGAVLRGPVFVGAGSRVNVGANVEGAAIGPGCKVGGEVHTSIFDGNANKSHQGFVGHSYIGRWCNLGADTNTSNLRNDYGTVSLYRYDRGDFVDTGRQFMGLAMGDHAKCSINTMFNTGTVVGVGCNLYGAGFHSRFVPAFSWGEPGAYLPYRLDKFMRVAEIVTARRDHTLTVAERELLAALHADRA